MPDAIAAQRDAPMKRARRTHKELLEELVSPRGVMECADRVVRCGCTDKHEFVGTELHDMILAERWNRVAIPARHLREFVETMVNDFVYFNRQSGKWDIRPVPCGTHMVCINCWKEVYGIGYTVWSGAFKNMTEQTLGTGRGAAEAEQAARGGAMQGCIAWCTRQIEEQADGVDPASGLRMIDRIDRLAYLVEYCEDLESGLEGIKDVRPDTFFKCLKKAKESFTNLMDRKLIPFARCAMCHAFKIELHNTRNLAERQAIRATRLKHIQDTRLERLKYYKHREKARRHPEKYMSIITDGMDQAKLNFPHYTRDSKGNTSLPTSLMGVLVHGVATFFYVVPHSMKGGANENITALILSIKKLQKQYEAQQRTWPSVLYVQLDNTTKDNKNKFVLAVLAEFVSSGVFRKVKLSFLYVGHTHEDIDQIFSVVSRALRNTNVLTIKDFLDMLYEKVMQNKTQSNKQKGAVYAQVLAWVWNVHGWTELVRDKKFAQYTRYHVFRFTIEPKDESTRLHVREWSRDDDAMGYWPKTGAPDYSLGVAYKNEAGKHLRDKIGIAAFDGKMTEKVAESVLNSAIAQAKAAPVTWQVDRATMDVDASSFIQEWRHFFQLQPYDESQVTYTEEMPQYMPWPSKPSWNIARQEPVMTHLTTEQDSTIHPIQGTRVGRDAEALGALQEAPIGATMDGPHTGNQRGQRGIRKEATPTPSVTEATGMQAPEEQAVPQLQPNVTQNASTNDKVANEEMEEEDADEDCEEVYNVARILGAKCTKGGDGEDKLQLQVLWEASDITWEHVCESRQNDKNSESFIGKTLQESAEVKGMVLKYTFAKGSTIAIDDDEPGIKEVEGVRTRKAKVSFRGKVLAVTRTKMHIIQWEDLDADGDEGGPTAELDLCEPPRGCSWECKQFAQTADSHTKHPRPLKRKACDVNEEAVGSAQRSSRARPAM